MDDLSILIGGKAGEGIAQSGVIIADILSQLGYRIYIYLDYPSLIRGGHNFSLIRASKEKKATHLNKIDLLLALNQDTIDFHKQKLTENAVVIYDSDSVKPQGLASSQKTIGLPLKKIIKEENAADIMRNSCIIGGMCKAIGAEWSILEKVFRKNISKETDLNLKIGLRGYDNAEEKIKVEPLKQSPLPIFMGNEVSGLGLIKGGLDAYVAYPMTPSSSILHFVAQVADDFGIKVVHPESEISVILMALGFAYTGKKAAVGTSGGGFCLMTEALSLAGQAELPVTIVVAQRPGPSTGVPTYTSQADLHFILSAGQGEFSRFVVAPGDVEELYSWSQAALNLSWKYQIPSIILTDKALGEGTYSFDMNLAEKVTEEPLPLWDRKDFYKRYLDARTGISPLAFAPDKEAIIKVNSYEHDEFGLTTEVAGKITSMQDKRLRKEKFLKEETDKERAVKVYGKKNAKTALLCWGSNKGVCVEVADKLGLKVIQPVILSPFPEKRYKEAVKGVKKIISVENNATGQLVQLINRFGFDVDKKILRYDGWPFSLEELEEAVKKVVK